MDVAARESGVSAGDMRMNSRSGVGVVVIVVAVFAVGITWMLRRDGRAAALEQSPGWPPLPRHVQIEVLNTTKMSGAARVGMLLLRHAGFDVVKAGDAELRFRDMERNRIVVRRGDTTGVGRILEALGGADVVDSADATRLVDLTVFLGKKFAPPRDRVSPNR